MDLNSIKEASRLYAEMIACYKKFVKGDAPGANYGKVVGAAINICKLDLPDPFKGLEPVAVVEAARHQDEEVLPGQIDVEEVIEVAEPEQPEEQAKPKSKWFGRR